MAVVAVVVGVLVWPTPKDARAANQYCRLTLDWNGIDSYDVNVHVVLYDASMVQVGQGDLTPDQNFEVWDGNINDNGTTPAYVEFDWDYDPDLVNGWQWYAPPNIPANPPELTVFVGSGTYLSVFLAQ
jgi:hypothetical protein